MDFLNFQVSHPFLRLPTPVLHKNRLRIHASVDLLVSRRSNMGWDIEKC